MSYFFILQFLVPTEMTVALEAGVVGKEISRLIILDVINRPEANRTTTHFKLWWGVTAAGDSTLTARLRRFKAECSVSISVPFCYNKVLKFFEIKGGEMKKGSVSICPFVAVIRYTFDFAKRLPYKQRYLSCMTFSVYEDVRVTCQDKTRRIRRIKLEELSQNCARRDYDQKRRIQSKAILLSRLIGSGPCKNRNPVTPLKGNSGFWNPRTFFLWNTKSGKFSLWNPKYWALESGIQVKANPESH